MRKIITIKLNKEFKRAYYKGKFTAYPAIVTYLVKNNLCSNRVGITVSSKIGNAVTRNRCRRIIKAAYRQIAKENIVPQGTDIVFVARQAIVKLKSDEVYKMMKKQIFTTIKRK